MKRICANTEGTNMTFDKEARRRMLPNLAKELDSNENRYTVNSARTDTSAGERATSKGLTHYEPDVIDFIRRCDTSEQAEEIIAFMERKGEIQNQYANELREQLKSKGVRSFGSKKEQDYYLKHGEL